jgi:predicted MFS family arabinose efflux permease
MSLAIIPGNIIFGLIYDKKGFAFAAIYVYSMLLISMIIIIIFPTSLPAWFTMSVFYGFCIPATFVLPILTINKMFVKERYQQAFLLLKIPEMTGNYLGIVILYGVFFDSF